MKRLLVPLAFLLAGCADMGVGPIVALEEAERLPPTELVAAVHAAPAAPDPEIIVAGRLWVPWGRPAELAPGELRSVGSFHGTTVYAWAWDRAPFDALFTRHDGEWQGYASVIGRSGAGMGGAGTGH